VNSDGSYFYNGVYGRAIGLGSGIFTGVLGSAQGSGTNVGVYGSALFGQSNWAGYFDDGNVHIQNVLGIGHHSPSVALDILQPQAIARLTTESANNGSVLDLRNTKASPTYLGAINFTSSDIGAAPGQIGYYADHSLAFRVNATERMRITAVGRVGIGTTAPNTALELQKDQTVIRAISLNALNGSVLDLGNVT
jgi:hypothetical protein